MKKYPEYKLKTLEDIVNAINENNAENFLKDFTGWLGLQVAIKKENLPEGIEIQQRNYTMTWIDDGKNKAKITITIDQKPNS